MRFTRYSLKALLVFMLMSALSTSIVVTLLRTDDVVKIGRNELISGLTRVFLTEYADEITDDELRRFLGLNTPFRDELGRECIGDETRVELVVPLSLQNGSVWFVRDHSEGCFSKRTFAAILIDDSGKVKNWTVLEGLPALDGCARSVDGIVAEKLLLNCDSSIGGCNAALTVQLDGTLLFAPGKPIALRDCIEAIVGGRLKMGH